jgi:hypothetical protein
MSALTAERCEELARSAESLEGLIGHRWIGDTARALRNLAAGIREATRLRRECAGTRDQYNDGRYGVASHLLRTMEGEIP